MKTAAGDLKEEKPYIYQEIAGEKVAVEGSFALAKEEKTAYGFAVAAYDPRYPLVIDPLLYSTYLGGSDWDYGYGIAVDSAGNAYVTGNTYSTNFPTTDGAYDESHNDYSDAFVTKLNPAGSDLVYSTYLGGNSGDWGSGIAVDSTGNAYVTGVTRSTNFPTTGEAFDQNHNGYNDAFVTRLNADGSALVYSTYLGGNSGDWGSGIAVDGARNAYVTGYTWSTDFPTTGGAYDRDLNGIRDAFVTKLNPAGSDLVYSTYLGGNSGEYGYGIAVDSAGNAYVTGNTYSTNFPTTDGAYDVVLGGSSDAFVTKLNPAGSDLAYSTYLGGSDWDSGRGIAVDGTGNAYVTGETRSTDFPTTGGAVYGSPNGYSDAFVTKLYPGVAATAPDITVTPLSVTFGDVLVGTTADRVVTVKNDGDANLTIGPVTNPAAPFSIVEDNVSNQTLAPGGEATLTVRFSPAAAGSFNGSFNIPSNDPDENPVTVNLSGHGIGSLYGKTIGSGQIAVPGSPGFAQFVFNVFSRPDHPEPKGILTYKDSAEKVNFHSEKINSLVFDFTNQKAVFSGTAKSPAGAIQATAFKVEVEDHNGAGNDLFKIRLYDKNNTEIYYSEGPLKIGNIRLLSS